MFFWEGQGDKQAERIQRGLLEFRLKIKISFKNMFKLIFTVIKMNTSRSRVV